MWISRTDLQTVVYDINMNEKIVTRIDYKDNRDTPLCAEVGKFGVTEIIEHCAGGEGDRWFYDIVYDESYTLRVFNPVMVHKYNK